MFGTLYLSSFGFPHLHWVTLHIYQQRVIWITWRGAGNGSSVGFLLFLGGFSFDCVMSDFLLIDQVKAWYSIGLEAV